ncbi:uncharacterized protein LOC125058309 [Pieris napi]|uniref:uncharacterized protein LOC125058309 n=1 Tax=Pieris napi TaxID=78633 RepID=UPI001FBB6729|nr:uncharacterized protein LOC125058309 [Pieris napi]
MKSIVALCLLVWGCQGQNNNSQSINIWLETFLTPTDKGPTDCYTENQQMGQCVKLSECMDRNEIDLEKEDVYRGISCHKLEMCCPTSRLVTTGTVTPPPKPKKRAGCGWSNPGGYSIPDSSKTYAEFEEFPWMVSVLRKVSQNQAVSRDPNDSLEGGSLIHHSVLMKIAHKINAIKNDRSLVSRRIKIMMNIITNVAKTTRRKVSVEMLLCKSVNGLNSSGDWLNSLSKMDPVSEAPVKKIDKRPEKDPSSPCLTSMGEIGECISYFSCYDGPQDKLHDKGSRLGCSHHLHVCCTDVPTGYEDLELT